MSLSNASELFKQLQNEEANAFYLFLDYDGTLAPFKEDPMTAYPYAGVESRLNEILTIANVHVTIVSGRPVREIQSLLKLKYPYPIWGKHGYEFLSKDGRLKSFPVNPTEAQGLDCLEKTVRNFPFRVEKKESSVAVHFRGFADYEDEKKKLLLDIAALANKFNLDALPFDQGIEVRGRARNKGIAIAESLPKSGNFIAAFLGDDYTDEDGFKAIREKGYAILVRHQPRNTAAKYYLTPPQQVLDFFDLWIHKTKRI